MDLEIDIEDLLSKSRVESDRIEFKRGWNPDSVYNSICAFANDYNNCGGGYIVVGVDAENGIAIRPVSGIPEDDLDKIQREMIGYNNLMSPPYFPKVVPVRVDNEWILVIEARTGNQRPYKVPYHVTNKNDKRYEYFIRYGTSSIVANLEQERELIAMTDQTPFDCRANHVASYADISKDLLEDHLNKTGSKLAGQVRERGVEAVLDDMQLLIGPPELRYIQNVAVMMFCEHMEKFYRYSYVQIYTFPNGAKEHPEVCIDEPRIMGSVPQMINQTLDYFKRVVLHEKVVKVPDKLETIRFWNYPFDAIKEAVVNAFYHRDYMSNEPVTIEIQPNYIEIISFPGIDRAISSETIAEGERFVSRNYRNRRLGEFLKELKLSEGRSSGIPTIQGLLRYNGSPKAEFITDEERKCTRVRIPIHPGFIDDNHAQKSTGVNGVNGVNSGVNGVNSGVNEPIKKSIDIDDDSLSSKDVELLSLIRDCPDIKLSDLAEKSCLPLRTLQRRIDKLTKAGYLVRVGNKRSGSWTVIV